MESVENGISNVMESDLECYNHNSFTINTAFSISCDNSCPGLFSHFKVEIKKELEQND